MFAAKKIVMMLVTGVILLFLTSVHGEASDLGFPLEGHPFMPSIINSVFDHFISSGAYNLDNSVRAYTRETGNKTFGNTKDCYKKDSVGSNFGLSGNYRGAFGTQYLCYDGHPGIDFKANGAQVFAVDAGVIIDLKNDAPDEPNLDCGCFGNFVKIDHKNGFISIYGHLKKGSITKQKGSNVTKGELIGISGNSGVSSGPHLHFELRRRNIAVDPYLFWSPVTKTGQTTCYDQTGNAINCTGTGQDGEIQAGVTWPTPRFKDNGDGTMADNLTGLMWTKDAGTPNVGSCVGGAKTWTGALNYVACLNNSNYLSHSDWRLPNINEQASLENLGESNQASWLNSQGFTNVWQAYYWSSTTYAYAMTNAWVTHMLVDLSVTYIDKNRFLFVWPVRSDQSAIPTSRVWKTGQKTSYYPGDDGALNKGVSWPNPRFTDHNDGTVTDNLTGLMWLKDASCLGFEWWGNIKNRVDNFIATPNNYSCSGLTVSYPDWRVPNKMEIFSLIDRSKSLPFLALPEGNPFVGLNTVYYYYGGPWSSTNQSSDPTQSLSVHLGLGFDIGPMKSYSHPLWLIRGGLRN